MEFLPQVEDKDRLADTVASPGNWDPGFSFVRVSRTFARVNNLILYIVMALMPLVLGQGPRASDAWEE